MKMAADRFAGKSSLASKSLVAVAVVLCFRVTTVDRAFVTGVGGIALRGENARTRRHVVEMPDFETQRDRVIREKLAMDDYLYPPEDMWNMEDPDVMKDYYPGARSFWTVWWAFIVFGSSIGFFTVGISAYLGYDVIDLSPVTQQYLWFLRTNEGINFVPQGAFMSFYGFFGTLLIAPYFMWMSYSNAGQGVYKFDRRKKRVIVVRNNYLLEDRKFRDIDHVLFEWCGATGFGIRAYSCIMKDGSRLNFMPELFENKSRRILERRATDLARFIGKRLEIDET